MTRLTAAALCAAALTAPTVACADPPRILEVRAEHDGMGWDIAVTLEHPDTGWDHYADGWEVLDAAGNRLGYRELHHPHVDEQPFTRSLANVQIPDGMRTVYVRARCSVDGWSDARTEVPLRLTE